MARGGGSAGDFELDEFDESQTLIGANGHPDIDLDDLGELDMDAEESWGGGGGQQG